MKHRESNDDNYCGRSPHDITRANNSVALKIVYFLLHKHMSLLTIVQGTTNEIKTCIAMYFSSMIQDKMDFKSRWMPITGDWEAARVGTSNRQARVFLQCLLK